MFPKSVLFAFFIVVLAYIYDPIKWQEVLRSTLRTLNEDRTFDRDSNIQILKAWENLIREPEYPKHRIAVGINVNADLILSGTSLLRKLGVEASGNFSDHSTLNSLAQLEEAFAFFFEKGAGVERYFSNGEVFQRIIQAGDSLKEKSYFVGGNAALMALKIAGIFQDTQVLLIGPSGPKVRNLLLPNIQIPANNLKDTDEVHLIMEYAKDESWGNVVTPVATRFITSHDVSNSQMDALEGFADSINEFKPDLIVFSGLHLLDGQSEEFRSLRIEKLLHQMTLMPSQVPTHLELASMADPQLVKHLYSEVIGSFDSLGLNEQELVFMSSSNAGPHPDLKAINGYPDIPAVADIIFWLLSKKSATSLTRVHFHSLTYHIIAIRKGNWSNCDSAVAVGARTGGLQACDKDPIDPDEVELRIPSSFQLSLNDPVIRETIVHLDPTNPVLSWERDFVKFYFSPVLVCKAPLKTVGLGDAISGTGLVFSDKLSLP